MGMTTHNLYAWIKKFGPESNAVAESFFQLLKRERIKRHVYATRNEARLKSLITSKYFTTHGDSMVLMTSCHL
jgi:hypothetical protein